MIARKICENTDNWRAVVESDRAIRGRQRGNNLNFCAAFSTCHLMTGLETLIIELGRDHIKLIMKMGM
jgi:hypothetical protein